MARLTLARKCLIFRIRTYRDVLEQTAIFNLAHRPAELCKSAVIEVHIRTKAIWIAANDGKHQRQIVVSRANDGFRTATDPNPGLERAAFDRRKYALIGEGRARLASPCDWLVF